MVSLTALWLPIVLSTVLAFLASSVIHMVLGYHSTHWKRFPNEEGVLEALRSLTSPRAPLVPKATPLSSMTAATETVCVIVPLSSICQRPRG